MTITSILDAVAGFLQKSARPAATIIVSVAIAHAIERNPVWDVLAIGAFIVTGHIASRGCEKIFGRPGRDGGAQ